MWLKMFFPLFLKEEIDTMDSARSSSLSLQLAQCIRQAQATMLFLDAFFSSRADPTSTTFFNGLFRSFQTPVAN